MLRGVCAHGTSHLGSPGTSCQARGIGTAEPHSPQHRASHCSGDHGQAALLFLAGKPSANPGTAAASPGRVHPAQAPCTSPHKKPSRDASCSPWQPPALTTSPSPRTSLPHALPGVLPPEPSPSTPSDKLRRCPNPPGAAPALRGSRQHLRTQAPASRGGA